MTYMICNGQKLNLVLSHPDKSDTSKMSQEEMRKEMESYFGNWDPVYVDGFHYIMRSLMTYIIDTFQLDEDRTGNAVYPKLPPVRGHPFGEMGLRIRQVHDSGRRGACHGPVSVNGYVM